MSMSNTRGAPSGSKSQANVSAEVKKLFRKGGSDVEALVQLKGKYSNEEMVHAIFDAYKERQEFITNKARKFKRVIYDRYSDKTMSSPQLIKKARKYKDKYSLDESEFNFFLNSVLSDRVAGGHDSHNLPNTAMSKVFGHTIGVVSGDKLRVAENELDVLQDILKRHGETRVLHSNVVLQSLTYVDCGVNALTGDYNPELHDGFSYVHPVIAALFMPRISLLDEHMLIANLANIVKLKHEGKAIATKPDFELYWDILYDKNDLVCDMESPLKDLKNRVVLQTRLWDAVFNLRQGKYYDSGLTEFMGAVDSCRNNIYDAPDLAYVRDESTILRKLMGAFSLRPTVVSTSPLYGALSSNPYVGNMSLTELDRVPMMTLRLPLNLQGGSVSVNLDEVFNQAQWFVENKTLVPKNRSILYSNEVLFFHVNRRFQTVNVGRLTSPFNFSQLPMTVSSYEAMNDVPVQFERRVKVGQDDFELRSVVLVDRTDIGSGKKLITGCSAGIIIPGDLTNPGTSVIKYSPTGPLVKGFSGNQATRSKPVTRLSYNGSLNNDKPSFYTLASETGTIFMYQKVRTGDNPYLSVRF